MNTIHQIAKKNGYPITIIDKLNAQIMNKNLNNIQNNLQTQQNSIKKWITFEYHSPIIKKITNIFKNTNLHITYRVSNTTHKLLKIYHRNKDIYTNIYSLKCNTCNMQYVWQTGRNLKTRFSEHHRYIRTNDPKSAYALHILNNRHEYGPLQPTMELLKICNKGWRMNTMESSYIQK